eukprot:2888418-Amphidinium_carterae.1
MRERAERKQRKKRTRSSRESTDSSETDREDNYKSVVAISDMGPEEVMKSQLVTYMNTILFPALPKEKVTVRTRRELLT